MSKQMTNLIAVLCRRIPFTATLDSSQSILARNSHYRNCRHQQAASVLTFKHQNYTTSSHAEQESSSEAETSSTTDSSQPKYVCHFRGLPHSIQPQELVYQLSKAKITVKGGKSGVHFFLNTNVPKAGLQAYVEMESEHDFNEAKSRPQIIKRRSIDVFCAGSCSMCMTVEVDMSSVMRQSVFGVSDQVQHKLSCTATEYVAPADITQMKEDLKDWAYTMPEADAVLRLDGLPFTWTFEELKEFFNSFNQEIVKENVTPILGTGIVYVSLPSSNVAERLIEENRPKRYIGNRYVDMRVASSVEAMLTEKQVKMSRARKEKYSDRRESRRDDSAVHGKPELTRDDSAVHGKPELTVYLRGLPFWVDTNRINEFFSPLVPESIQLTKNREGRSDGCAYVSFSSPSDYEEALKRNRAHIANRYIEVYPKRDGW